MSLIRGAVRMLTIEITRQDLSISQLRAEAARTADAKQARRILAVAMVLDEHPRLLAAQAGGMDRQKQPELVGRGLGARGAVGRQMRLPGLDVVFRLAAPAVDILVKYTDVADLQAGDEEACVGPFHAGLHAGDDPLDAAPAGGPVEELLEAAHLALLR